ncbi:hypothetical protein BKN38_05885 [Helicobacter sp. CLO-3]|uniref:alpha/beta fold hydrolase n=1 Tax=unclassified Helicobacter TaxID=2593540 RepID=UPI00080497C3|nr:MULTISPECIES: alpha/beta fold hydrolase [unclassified Helicobacter]OBV29499.1 hypothetical protein BA723_05485 [Helicobacter sp. CLO-3]OHU83067.1 hypothetical protein BKN38_05885 [Helicobacter sp. CLO-3]
MQNQNTQKAREIKVSKNLRFASDFGDVAYDLYEPLDDASDSASKDSSAQASKAPAQTPKIIQIAHGMIEHKDRYEWVAREFAKRGYIVAVSDHRGHGESVNESSGIALGSMGEDGFARASYDLYKLTCLLKERYEGARVVLLGHSMGSLLSRRYVSMYGEALSALVLSGSPALDPNLELGIKLAKMLRFFGAKTFGQKFFTKLLFGGFEKKFRKNGEMSGVGWLCSDKEVAKAYKADPKCSFMFDMESFLNLFLGMQDVYGEYPSPKNPHIPILFVSGNDDASGHFGVGVQRACAHLEAQGFDDVGILLYQGARHEILNEPIKAQVVADIALWLEAKGLQ